MLYLFVYENLPINSVLQHPISEKISTISSISWKKNTISPVPSCSLTFFDILWPSRFPRAAASVPSPSSGNASTLPGRPCRSHRHIAWQPWQPAWQPATVRVFSLGSQLETLQETTHLKLLLVKKPRVHGSSAMMWDSLRCELWRCEQDWTSETCEKILQNQDVPRCAKMCQDVPRLQLFFHHSYSSFAFLLENVKRSKLRTSCLAPQQWQCQISVFLCSPHSLMFRPSTDCALLLPAYLPGPLQHSQHRNRNVYTMNMLRFFRENIAKA